MNFGSAIVEMKRGRKVAREGWNGRNMSVLLLHGVSGFMQDYRGLTHEVYCSDCFAMITVSGTIQAGWLASQADMLADDWFIRPEADDGL